MSDITCLFCKLANKDIPTEIIFENDHCIVIKDIAPKAEIHWLALPKQHITDLRKATDVDREILGSTLVAAATAVREKAHDRPFKIIANNGREAGQHIFHLHFHILIGSTIVDMLPV